MTPVITTRLRPLLLLAGALALVACGGGGGGGGTSATGGSEPGNPAPPAPAPAPTPLVFDEAEATRFLSQATFGPSRAEIDALVDSGPEAWLLDELAKPPTLHLDRVLAGFPADGNFVDDNGNTLPQLQVLPSNSWWDAAIAGDDQLRQRMAFALSQILVVSADGNVGRVPQALAQYMDILTEGAFGNYRDLLEEVTYSPAMAIYLTYLRNEKADARTGRVPDENYAREILQLFTIGLVALEDDGTPALDGGAEQELFDNDDITGLAKVFTGLSWSGAAFNTRLNQLPLTAFYTPLQMFDNFHSTEAKRFLGTTIPANTAGEESIDLALDTIFNHPNVGPFVGRQLIQRFVTSDPVPAYVARVAAAFDDGSYTLPAGEQVGNGQRGDLAAVIAAVLFDSEARDPARTSDVSFGKLREPVLRFTHWARAFDINSADASNERALRYTGSPESLGQQPYGSPSVFNFYRPGYIAAGTETGDAGLTAPELQITNASSIIGYANFLSLYALELSPKFNRNLPAAFVPDYDAQMALADDPAALLDNLDGLLTHGTLAADTRARITDVLDILPANSQADRRLRAQAAAIMVMTAPEYIVLR